MPAGEPSPSHEHSVPPEPESSRHQMATRNPGAGCIIIIIAILSLSFLVGFGIWNLFKLDQELGKFTDSEPRATPAPDLVANAAAVNVLNSKIEIFTTDVGHQREATITLTPEEINLAIAIFDHFEELRETFYVKSIADGKVHIEISFPMRGSPTRKGDKRYLNGTMVATPELTGGEIFLVVERVEVPGKSVPDGFIGQLSPYRPAQQYLEDEILGPWMKRLTALGMEDGKLALTITPDETPPATGPVEIKPEHIVRAAVLGGLILVSFVGFMLYAAKRNQELKGRE